MEEQPIFANVPCLVPPAPMNNYSTPSAQWDAMSDEERVAWLATNIMGWETKYEKDCYDCDYLMVHWPDSTPFYAGGEGKGWIGRHGFDPILHFDEWDILEEKVTMDITLCNEFIMQFGISGDGDAINAVRAYMQADLRNRCKALYIAYNSIQTNHHQIPKA